MADVSQTLISRFSMPWQRQLGTMAKERIKARDPVVSKAKSNEVVTINQSHGGSATDYCLLGPLHLLESVVRVSCVDLLVLIPVGVSERSVT